jgi:SAM-dependent methyltransferase
MSSRYSRPIDLDDVNNAHSLGILLVPDGSHVLDIGTADGSVAQALVDRGCRVWGIEVDADAARDAERVCERVIVGDVEQLDWQTSLEGRRFDVVLLLDVLEHLRDPAATLKRAVSHLAPGGRIVASIPNVAHAAVRLQLLNGRFERTDVGLLDRTHVQFFDRSSVERLLADADLVPEEDLQVLRRIDETEIHVKTSAFSAETLRMIAADPESQVYQFVIAAVPKTATVRRTHDASLASALQKQVVRFRELESWAWSLEAQVREAQARNGHSADGPDGIGVHGDGSIDGAGRGRATVFDWRWASQPADDAPHVDPIGPDEVMIEIARIRDDQTRTAAALNVRERALKEREHAAATRSSELALLRRDLLIKEAYLAELRLVLDQRPTAGDLDLLRHELEALRHERDARIAELERRLGSAAEETATQTACIGELRGALAALDAAATQKDQEIAALRAELEIRPTRAAFDALASDLEQTRETLRIVRAFPRYRIADRLNNMLRLTGPLHAWLRRATTRALKDE